MRDALFHTLFFFFFQAEDGIRDLTVTGVQTCALPIWRNGAAGGAASSRSSDRTCRSRSTRSTASKRGGCLRLRPHHALVLAGDRSHALEDKFLEALPFVGLGGVDVLPRISRDAVHTEELAGLAAAVAEAGQDIERLPIQDVHPLVSPVGHVHVRLPGIPGEGDLPH